MALSRAKVRVYVCSSHGVPGGVGGRYGAGRRQRNLNFWKKKRFSQGKLIYRPSELDEVNDA